MLIENNEKNKIKKCFDGKNEYFFFFFFHLRMTIFSEIIESQRFTNCEYSFKRRYSL